MSMTTAAVLGTGAWGTTFAQVLADAGVDVTMWGRNADTIAFINGHENPTYLPGITLSERIEATTDIARAVSGKQLVVVAVPVKAVRVTLEAARASFAPNAALLSLAKGLELVTLKRVDQIIADASGVPGTSHRRLVRPQPLPRDCRPAAHGDGRRLDECGARQGDRQGLPQFLLPSLRLLRRGGHRDGWRHEERHRGRDPAPPRAWGWASTRVRPSSHAAWPR